MDQLGAIKDGIWVDGNEVCHIRRAHKISLSSHFQARRISDSSSRLVTSPTKLEKSIGAV